MAVLDRTSWAVVPPDPEAGGFAEALGVHPLVGALLRRRGATTVEAAQAFLHPRLDALADPASIPGMAAAVEVIAEALRSQQRIAIHGDYDVDGISATAILLRGLRALGADPLWYLPHRIRDGYGLGVTAVDHLAAEGARLLITVDCGITAYEAIARARSRGLDVVVLDHHTPGQESPPATIVAPDPEMEAPPCAAGLAWLCMWALRRRLECAPERPTDLLALAALGTVADVVPLLGDNRILVASGLLQMQTATLPGLRALIEEAGIPGPVDSWHIGWMLGPRLNAPGRLGDPEPALRLLVTDEAAEARTLARDLDALNRERQMVLEQVLTEATAQAQADLSGPALVVAGSGWHPGVVGLVAGRLVEQYRRPAVAIALSGEEGRGSARGVEGFDLVEALEACRDHLQGFGGHAMAAGLSIAAGEVGAFRRSFCEAAASRLAGADAGRLHVDAEVPLADLTPRLVGELDRLAPFGAGNSPPVLAVRGVHAVSRRLAGDRAHLRLGVTDGTAFVEAIGFEMAAWGELLAFTDASADLAFVLERDRFDPDRVRMRLRALDVPGVDLEAILADTSLLVDRLFRRASDYLEDSRSGVEDTAALYTKVVGVTFDARQGALAAAREGDPLRLGREPANPHDPHAIRVATEEGQVLGYLNAQLAGRLAPTMDAGARYRATVARVTGGGDRHLGMNIYIERAEDGPRASGAPARRSVWAAFEVREAIDRLPFYLTEGRPLRPAHAEALQAIAAGRPAVLSIAPGRGRAAVLASGAALALPHGSWALVIVPLRRHALHRAEQLASRLEPLGLRIVPVHGLLSVSEREHAAAALRAGDVDVIVATAEALGSGDLLAPYLERAGTVIIDGLSADEIRVLPLGLDLLPAARDHGAAPAAGGARRARGSLPALIVTAASASAAIARVIGPSVVVHDYAPRPLLQIVDRRETGDRDAVAEEVLSGGEKCVVYTGGRQECVRLATRLRDRLGERGTRVGYLHGGLPARLRQIVTRAFRDGRLTALVATPALDEEALPPDVRQVMIAGLPWDREAFLAACGAGGLDHRPVTVTVAPGRDDAEARGACLNAHAPGREMLVKIYRALRDWKRDQPFLWPDAETWTRLSAALPEIPRESVGAACAILEEAGLAVRESAASGPVWRVQLVAVEGRKDLTASVRYREGLRERAAYGAFAAWARTASPAEITRAILA